MTPEFDEREPRAGVNASGMDTTHLRSGFCIYIDTLCQGAVPAVSDGERYTVFETELEAQIDVKPSYGLADDDIARMLQESFTTAEADVAARALVEARVEADRMLLATQSALEADGALLAPQERADIDALMLSLRAIAANSEDAAAIEAATKALAQGTEAFAAARMNASIQKALSGKNVSTL